ncbi:hypothetical protein [Pontibacter chinhatensis]|uniref:Uncharacterized protein n=1 Tax=Pontibacter chinhatensis TaxID=1436961 RepID=A0A1I2QGX2_9BACT|nr:hypothetical protein [Pontibacter chinhatensis]SFG27548.1 hypothetical protein SAMN05421739_1025 [Pontibacter chinhatensis]
MLEYIKMVLWKVSFDKALFEKELRKGMAQLETEELVLLEDWCYELFYDKYHTILSNIFRGENCKRSSYQPQGTSKVYTGSRPNILGF